MTTNPPKLPQTDQAKAPIAEKSFKWLIILLATIAGCLLLFYFSIFHGGIGDKGDFGAFGDYFGGVLNPILGFATVSLLVWSLKYQMDELALSRQELALTRQELAETKEETALSRKAMEAQVEHLQKEAKLNELVRLMSDLRVQFQTQISSKVNLNDNILNLLLKIELNSSLMHNPDALVKTRKTSIYNIFYEDGPINANNNIEVAKYLKEQYKEDISLNKHTKWNEVEIILANFSTLVLKYYDLSNNPDLAYVYLDEARRMVTPFHEILESDVIRPQFINIKAMLVCKQALESSRQVSA